MLPGMVSRSSFHFHFILCLFHHSISVPTLKIRALVLHAQGVENDDPGNEASPMTTMNGVYELVYFRYALSVAPKW